MKPKKKKRKQSKKQTRKQHSIEIQTSPHLPLNPKSVFRIPMLPLLRCKGSKCAKTIKVKPLVLSLISETKIWRQVAIKIEKR